ncbi:MULTISPECIES: HAD family hydrolase [unclassified Enterococcus]|uniref:HAD family hydrolase n=1 Tax=unclassified Enterococcus TaxID=2608891 RepID=UPI0024753D86|nr:MULTISPECIES: HAD family hydrolase [unclassified Enterococcus]
MKNVKLIASDMDHTLLTEESMLPPNFAEYVSALNEKEIEFTIASGRPLYTLTSLFPDLIAKMSLISDNGAAICYHGEMIYKSLLAVADYQQLIAFVENQKLGVPILCGIETAYIAKKHQQYQDFFANFYSKMEFVDDLQALEVEANKFTIYFPKEDSKLHYQNLFAPKYAEKFSITVGDTIWIDIMNKGVNKGQAMKILGEKINVSADEMMAFGDTYNDIEMLQTVKFSYLVANAAEDMAQYANYRTKSNDEYGVLVVLEELL